MAVAQMNPICIRSIVFTLEIFGISFAGKIIKKKTTLGLV